MFGRRLRIIAVVGAVATTLVVGTLPAAAAEGDLLREGSYTEKLQSRYFKDGTRAWSKWFELDEPFPEDFIASDQRLVAEDYSDNLEYTLKIRARKKSGHRTACAVRALVWEWRNGEWQAAMDTWTPARSSTRYSSNSDGTYGLRLWTPTSVEVASNGHCRNVTVTLAREVRWREYEQA